MMASRRLQFATRFSEHHARQPPRRFGFGARAPAAQLSVRSVGRTRGRRSAISAPRFPCGHSRLEASVADALHGGHVGVRTEPLWFSASRIACARGLAYRRHKFAPEVSDQQSEGGDIVGQTFWILTGGISEPYETINVVVALVSRSIVNEAVFGKTDPTKHLRQAIDELARQAQAIGANGVLWIDFDMRYESALGSGILATGTAVRVNALL
jgi:uncharacterized protein YbjQ (UPF0145 family)